MKLIKFVVFALVALILVAVRANPLHSWDKLNKVFQLEESCVRQGGVCLLEADCDPDLVVMAAKNLCPKQQHLGVQCCYF